MYHIKITNIETGDILTDKDSTMIAGAILGKSHNVDRFAYASASNDEIMAVINSLIREANYLIECIEK